MRYNTVPLNSCQQTGENEGRQFTTEHLTSFTLGFISNNKFHTVSEKSGTDTKFMFKHHRTMSLMSEDHNEIIFLCGHKGWTHR